MLALDRRVMKHLLIILSVMVMTMTTARSWTKLKGFSRTTSRISMMGQATYNGGAAPEASTSSPSHHNFAYLKSLEERVNRLSSEESDCMLSFWTDKLKCFQIAPNMATNRVSITTTCLSINTILANPEHWTGRCRWDSVSPPPSPSTTTTTTNDDIYINPFAKPTLISLHDTMRALEAAPWSGDAFQTPLLVRTFCQLGAMDKVRKQANNGTTPFNTCTLATPTTQYSLPQTLTNPPLFCHLSLPLPTINYLKHSQTQPLYLITFTLLFSDTFTYLYPP